MGTTVSRQDSLRNGSQLYAALVFVYEYYPNARTLYEEHLTSKLPPTPVAVFPRHPKSTHSQTSRNASGVSPFPEETIWSYVTQIANAMKVVHDQGLAVRALDPTKVLIVGKNRCVSSLVSFGSVIELRPLVQNPP